MPRSVWFDRFGGPEVLYLADRPMPEPAPGEVRIKIEAIGVNRSESMMVEGLYKDPPTLPSSSGSRGR